MPSGPASARREPPSSASCCWATRRRGRGLPASPSSCAVSSACACSRERRPAGYSRGSRNQKEPSVSTEPLLRNPVAERLRSGGLALNLMVRHARTVDIALAARTCGFDGLFFDRQHGVIPEHEISQMAVAALNVGVAPLVRVPEKDYAAALRMLDNGALGIIMPEVTTV